MPRKEHLRLDNGVFLDILPILTLNFCMFGYIFAYYRISENKRSIAGILTLVISIAFTFLNNLGMIPYLVLFVAAFIASDKLRREPAAKMILFAILLFSITVMLFHNSGFSVRTLRIFVFNNAFGLPMDVFVTKMGITDPAIHRIIDGFVLRQSDFMFSVTTPGVVFVTCLLYSWLFIYLMKQTARTAPAPVDPATLKMPRWTILLLIVSYVSFRAIMLLPYGKYDPGSFLYNVPVSLFNSALLVVALRYLREYAGLPPPGKSMSWLVFSLTAVFWALYTVNLGKEIALTVSLLVWSGILMLFVLNGMYLVLIALGRTAATRSFIIITYCMSIIMFEMLYLFCLIGALDHIFGIRQLLRAKSAPAANDTQMADTFRMFGFCVITIASILFITSIVISSKNPSAAKADLYYKYDLPEKGLKGYTASESNNEIHITGPGHSYVIDKYEFPNKKGSVVADSVTPAQAQSYCAARGKRLCTPEEWAISCVAGDHNDTYYIHSDKNNSNKPVYDKCSWHEKYDKDWHDRCGKYPECKNKFGVHDMLGNKWEWVHSPANPGLAVLMGPGENNGCQRCTRCDWSAFYFPEQLGRLPAGKIGFRCCGDAPPR